MKYSCCEFKLNIVLPCNKQY